MKNPPFDDAVWVGWINPADNKLLDKRGKYLRGTKQEDGYIYVQIMGRRFRIARLIGLATVWSGETRLQIERKQVDHKNRDRSDNSPYNLNFLDEVDDAGRSAQSQNTRAALLQGPSWAEKAERRPRLQPPGSCCRART